MGPQRGWRIASPLVFQIVLAGSPTMWGPGWTPIWCIPVYNRWKVRLKTRTSRWRATEWVKRSTWENHESPKNSFTWSLILSIKWPVNSAKWLSSWLLDPLLINWHDGRQVPHPCYRIKTGKCTYKASAAIKLRCGKLGKMTIPAVLWDTTCMQQQPIRRLELSHMTRGIFVNKYGGRWTKSIYSYQHFPLVPGRWGEQRLLITSLKFTKPPHTYKTLFWGLTSSHYWVINDWKVEAGRILPQVVITIFFSRFKISPSTWVAMASCQRKFGHHNLSLNTFKGPSGTPRPGPFDKSWTPSQHMS